MHILSSTVAKYSLAFSFLSSVALTLLAEPTIDPARVREIAALLPDRPAGFAWPISDRADWQRLSTNDAFARVMPGAEKLLAKPLAEVPDSLFLEYSQNGNRTRWQNAEWERRDRLPTLTLAEAFENRGRFLPAIEQVVASLCAEKTWVYPAHDGRLRNLHGEEITPELGATGLAAEMAEADFVLGDKLTPATRQLIRDNVRRRVLQPLRDSVEGRRPPLHWLFLRMNWNAVCVGNTVFAALALEPDRNDRALYAAAGEHYIRYFLAGFTPDGYCAEGVGNWNYGFGHFILLTEALRQATGGKLDLFNDPAAIAPALFCRHSEILPGVFPSISDCGPGSHPSPQLTAYVSRRLGLDPGTNHQIVGRETGLAMGLMLSSLDESLPVARRWDETQAGPLRSFFPDGGVLISRTAPDARLPLAVCLKGGNNDEPHNHNDVGSFSLVVGRKMVVCDPGGEVYTRRTFGPNRYDSKVLNSFGHAVPIVAGQLQRAGAAARGVILETNFTADADSLKMDIRSTYAVKELLQLERTFTFHRGAAPSLDVSDTVKFSTPQTFETALITWGQARMVSTNVLEITDGESSVRVTIDTQGHAYQWRQELIDEDVDTRRKPVHLGILLNDKIRDGIIALHIAPVIQ